MAKLLVANWKMNPETRARAYTLAKQIDGAPPRGGAQSAKGRGVEVVIAPPFPFLAGLQSIVSRAKLAGQDCFWEMSGPYTGEVSPGMLKASGARYVIIGHSERRMHLHETDEMIHGKTQAALAAGLSVILCVGEPKDVRARGIDAARNFVAVQLERALAGISMNPDALPQSLIVAYEPVWAIGSGVPDKPGETVQMAKAIQSRVAHLFKRPGLAVRVLYGGSVNAENILQYLRHDEVSGALVGGASLNGKEFRKMILSVAALP